MTVGAPSYKGFRFPAEIISHGVWLYHRFPLSLREVQEMMLQRGIVVSHETIRQWCATFGQTYANGLRRRRARPGDKWHLDEVFITINGQHHYLWRAVDQHGNVLDILVTSRRDTRAATRFFRKLLKGLEYVPRVLITDKLRSYGAARRRVLRSVEHRQSKYLNNRAENSHQPTRARERAMKRFTSARHAQRFLSAFSGISPTSGPVVTASAPRSTAVKWPPDSPPGTRSPARPPSPDTDLGNRPDQSNHARTAGQPREVDNAITVDHVTVYRWVRRFTPLLIDAARPCRHAAGDRWFVDETYVKVAGRWVYLYRAIDQYGQVIDVPVSEKRDLAATRRFFARALEHGTQPTEPGSTDRFP